MKSQNQGLTKLSKIIHIAPKNTAVIGGTSILAVLAHFGIPASTTHAISGAIMGARAVKRISAVRWGIRRRIVWAWIITIPASAAVAYVSTLIIHTFV